MEALPYIVLGSAAGGIARYWLSGLVGRRVGETFPWGTIVVNVSGAFTIGLVAAVLPHLQASSAQAPVWPLAVIGFLGSYTTVSSFSLQTLMLLREGRRRRALANVVLSLGLCLAMASIGFLVGAPLAGIWARA